MAKGDTKDIRALRRRMDSYVRGISIRFTRAVNELLALQKTFELDEEGQFSFSRNKRLAKQAEMVLRELHASVLAAIENDISLEWEEGNKVADALVASKFGKEMLKNPALGGYMKRNAAALRSFLKRSDNGLNLSDRVWKTAIQLRTEMEAAITVSAGAGKSAAKISREVRQYLKEPNRLFRRIRTGFTAEGKPIYKLSKAAAAYHPGPGVYRSSYKNAMRLARTETNMAYRAADQERWRQMDFVIGMRVRLSHNHPEEDLCDELQGDYPKDFEFPGWHPNCFCFAVPITLDNKTFVELQRARLAGEDYDVSHKMITKMPSGFVNWVRANKGRIATEKKSGQLPYFVRDNMKIVEKI